jgi:undecaprenyl diphosphate synthase
MQLFIGALESEVQKLHRNGIRLMVIGERSRFDPKIQALIAEGERLTSANRGLTLTIAANYGGRWDILQALSRLAKESSFGEQDEIRESDLAPYLSMNYAPEPDLFIRTGGEQRVSNFLLWQLAYTELYFTDTLWPDFDGAALAAAFASYVARERRFGRTSEQLAAAKRGAAARAPQRAATDA